MDICAAGANEESAFIRVHLWFHKSCRFAQKFSIKTLTMTTIEQPKRILLVRTFKQLQGGGPVPPLGILTDSSRATFQRNTKHFFALVS